MDYYEYLEGKIEVNIENQIKLLTKLNKGDNYVKQQKSSNRRKKIFSNESSYWRWAYCYCKELLESIQQSYQVVR